MKAFLKTMLIFSFSFIVFIGCSNTDQEAVEKRITDRDLNETHSAIGNGDNEKILEKEDIENKTLGIPGSHYTDIKLGLEQRGFPKKKISLTDEFGYRSYINNKDDTIKGVKYDCNVLIGEAHTVVSADFGIQNKEALSNDEFLQLAEMYIKYCATMPYDTADTEAIRAWVEQNIKMVNKEESRDKEIGDAKFTLFRTEYPSGIVESIFIVIDKID